MSYNPVLKQSKIYNPHLIFGGITMKEIYIYILGKGIDQDFCISVVSYRKTIWNKLLKLGRSFSEGNKNIYLEDTSWPDESEC